MPTQSEIKIRSLTEADLDQVLAIEQASFPLPWSHDHFAGELEGRHSFPFVAESDDKIAGYVCLMSLFEEAQILDIAVSPEQRGRGIARMLLEHAISVARKQAAEVLALEVRASNVAAITLYEQCGFVRTGLRRNYYEGREDAVLMEKRLSFTALDQGSRRRLGFMSGEIAVPDDFDRMDNGSSLTGGATDSPLPARKDVTSKTVEQ